MRRRISWLWTVTLAMVLAFPWSLAHQALAQEQQEEEQPATAEGEQPAAAEGEQPAAAEGEQAKEEEAPTVSDEIFVTGSRIATSPLNQRAPVVELDSIDLQRSGLTNLGATLQELPSTGSAINTKFNVPGNSGFPQDGNGIGAGAIEVALHNLGAKRTLVLVDGKRWIAGASASGVPIAVDLNSLPANMIERIEVLQDGASAIYGSDAIGGVVNIITKREFEGMEIAVQSGGYASEGDGQASQVSGLWGGGDERTHMIVSLSYYDENGVQTSDRAQSAFPTPFATSCLAGGCSSFTPQGRFVLGPNFDFTDVTLNNGVLNDGGAHVPAFDPNNPNAGDFHEFATADRFNFNGDGFNYLQTPNERLNLHTSLTRELTDHMDFVLTGSYTNRKSSTKAAPEPLCLGNGCGNRILENVVVSRDNPYNPFGVDLSVANGNLEFFGRRPLEAGPRLFDQDVDTYFASAGLDGDLHSATRNFSWDVTASYGENRGFQQKHGAFNAARLSVALGDPAVCAATPNCVPFNFFGGQGPDGNGSFTREMLDYVTFVQRDFSEQTLVDLTANITGDLATLPNGGNIGFAAGGEYRKHDGSFQPDPIAASGETAGIPSGPTAGGFDVSEVYAELNFPLLFGATGAHYLELNLAGRYSDYSTFGGENTYKVGVLWQPIKPLSLRGSYSTGLRAPGIGELFGGAAREDFTFLDPCADVLGQIGTANGGRDTPQPQNIIDNCAALGVPVNFAQRNPQLSAVSAGNEHLVPETSDSYSFGVVYSPGGWTVSLDYYDLTINDAIQGRDPGDVVTACAETLDPFFCDAVERSGSGLINLVDNQLQNIGGVEASGADLSFRWDGKERGYGRFGAGLNATYLNDYTELTKNADGSLTSTDRTGTITNETFQRAFPKLRAVGTANWTRARWRAGLALRYVDSMVQESGNTLDARVFTDVQAQYTLPFASSAATAIVGANNVLNEDPAVCDSCGVIGMSPVVHDLPGVVVYARLVVDVD
jgi:iron complex outermembrane recepter protein